MKKLLLILFSCLSFYAQATHERAGEITYKCLGGYTYEISVITYTKLESAPADRCSLMVYLGNGDSALVCRSNFESGDPSIDPFGASCSGNQDCSTFHMGEWTSIPQCYNSKKNIYTFIHVFPGPGTYNISCQDPNRIHDIANIPDQTVLSLFDTLIINSLFGIGSSSPYFTNHPVDTAQGGICHTYYPGAIDPDGDSLSFELIPCEEAPGVPVAGYYIPSGVTINGSTGDITWCFPPYFSSPYPVPYNFAIRIKEWRKINNNYFLAGILYKEIEILVNGCSPFANVSEHPNNAAIITLSPNPSSENVSVQIQNWSGEQYNLCLYDYTGKATLVKSLNKDSFSFSTSEMNNGIYFIQLYTQDKIITTNILQVQH